MATERVLQTLGELPEGLLLRLPLHGGGAGEVCGTAVRGRGDMATLGGSAGGVSEEVLRAGRLYGEEGGRP